MQLDRLFQKPLPNNLEKKLHKIGINLGHSNLNYFYKIITFCETTNSAFTSGNSKMYFLECQPILSIVELLYIHQRFWDTSVCMPELWPAAVLTISGSAWLALHMTDLGCVWAPVGVPRELRKSLAFLWKKKTQTEKELQIYCFITAEKILLVLKKILSQKCYSVS